MEPRWQRPWVGPFHARGNDRLALKAAVDTHRMFERGETIRLCKEALASVPKTTKGACPARHGRQGLRYRRQGAHAMAQRMIHALREQWGRLPENLRGGRALTRPTEKVY
jgi:hypothetical protein